MSYLTYDTASWKDNTTGVTVDISMLVSCTDPEYTVTQEALEKFADNAAEAFLDDCVYYA